jgi:predicted nucleic-acid-binding protein
LKQENLKREIWIDTNIIIYFLRHNDQFSPSVKQIIIDAGAGKHTLKVSPLVIFECTFVLMGKQFGIPKAKIAEVLKAFVNLKGIETEEKSVVEEALTSFTKKGIDLVDAYLAAHAKAVSPPHVITVNVKDFVKLGVQVSKPEEIIFSLKAENEEGSR